MIYRIGQIEMQTLVSGLVVVLLALSPVVAGKTFAVLISAVVCDDQCSGNYGVESDIGRAYHVLLERGVLAENIIVMTPDDFANNSKNPWPGQVFDSEMRQTNVYAGLKIDYRGKDVNRENILAVLEGDSSAVKGGNGRVLNSTAEDNVFIYWAGHGDHGSLVMPDGETRLTAYELKSMFEKMNEKHMYKHLVIYLMACYSGSMFEGHTDSSLRIYAVTAANSVELARGTAYVNVPEATAMGRLISFASQFGRAWLDDVMHSDLNNVTLEDQYENIKESPMVTTHVTCFGDPKVKEEIVAQFQGNQSRLPRNFRAMHFVVKHQPPGNFTEDSLLVYLEKLLLEAHDAKEREKLSAKIAKLEKEKEQLGSQAVKISQIFRDSATGNVGVKVYISKDATPISRIPKPIQHLKCHDDLVKAIQKSCPQINKSNFFSQFLVPLANLCEEGHKSAEIIKEMIKMC